MYPQKDAGLFYIKILIKLIYLVSTFIWYLFLCNDLLDPNVI